MTIATGALLLDCTVVDGSADIEPYAIVAGNPGVTVGSRFAEAIVHALVESRWWEYDWPVIMGMPEYAGKFDLRDVPSFLSRLRDCDRSALPRITAPLRHVHAAGHSLTLDGLQLAI